MTIINFTPTSNANFQFSATLDNNTYMVYVTWNLFGVRYYINIYDSTNTLVLSTPLIGSILGLNISSITSEANIAVVELTTPHTFPVGSVVPFTISGVTPTTYNGTFNCSIINSYSFSYALSGVLPTVTGVGVANYNIDLVNGYFDSTMVYYPDNQQIIILP